MENKTTRIEIRVTQKEKEQLKKYAEENKTTISKIFREFINKIIKEKK